MYTDKCEYSINNVENSLFLKLKGDFPFDKLEVHTDLHDGGQGTKIKELVFASSEKEQFEFTNLQYYPINKSYINEINKKILDHLKNPLYYLDNSGYMSFSFRIEK